MYHYFRAWRLDGTWESAHTTLREQEWMRQGRDPQPSGCIMDSQSVKSTSVGGDRGPHHRVGDPCWSYIPGSPAIILAASGFNRWFPASHQPPKNVIAA